VKIAKLLRTEQLELVVPIDVNQISFVKIGTPVRIATEDDRLTWTGRVSRTGDVVNQQTQALDVFIQINPNENPVFDGMYLKAAIGGLSFDKAMEIPRSAVVNNNQVFLLENDSILKAVDINILRINKDKVLFSGVEENKEIVVEPVVGGFSGLKVFKLKEKEANP
jgi:hypothetical protein